VAARAGGDLSPVDDGGLPAEVKPLVGEINLLFDRVRLAFETQTHFVADAAHELRSPLTALKLQLQTLQRSPDGATREQAIARLAAGVDRATRLIEQLLVLAREEGRAGPAPPKERLDLAETLRLAVADAAPQAIERQQALSLDAPETPCPIDGHREALRILMRNLLDNAMKYTPPGGRIEVTLQPKVDGRWQLSVDDSGPGIEATERERVLDRFYRVPGSEASGSGLGLAIVHTIARAHGAELALDTSPLGGLRVSLALPARSS
jgi:two-component system OmpR family sensor kinase